MISRTIYLIVFTFLTCSSYAIAGDAGDAGDAEDDKEAIAKFLSSSVVKKFHKSAYGYAIFPTIGKGGFGIGGAFGDGRVYRGGKLTGKVSMSQISFGLQAGAQAYRQVIYFNDKRAFEEFTTGEFEFSAQLEAIAITSSVGATAGTEGKSASANESQSKSEYRKGLIVFTMGKGGLMYQAALGGQKYKYNVLK